MRQIQIIMLGFVFGISAIAEARDYSVTQQTPAVKFQLIKHDEVSQYNSTYNILPLDSDLYKKKKEKHKVINYYDALFYYPVHQHTGMNIDVGINLRFNERSADQYRPYNGKQDWLHQNTEQTTDYDVLNISAPNKTMLHANALFDLPLTGLSAGVSGSHDGRLEDAEFNYSARLNYQWKSGFGLQGGWQHQQYQLDQFNLRETVEDQRLFLDLKYQF